MHILIVDDDSWYAELLKYQIELNPDHEAEIVKDCKEYLKKLDQKPDVVCLDYNLPQYSGTELLKKTKSLSPNTDVIIISGQEDVNTAINLLREGAVDYIVKNDEVKERLWNTINRISENKELKKEVIQLRKKVSDKFNPEGIIGESEAMKKVFALVKKSLNNNLNVSITGETGTGKEVIANTIHFNSNRANKPFVAVNVAAIPENLLESELFGHEKGSFTGAYARRIGKFEEANGGTIFLDEIADLSLPMQAKILRVLQEREVVRIGGNTPIKLDIRIISATHKNLLDLIAEQEFRQDLYFRLFGIEIEIPPLRERGNDIFLLSNSFIKKFCDDNGIPTKKLSSEAEKKLKKHPFSGNVRELKAIIELASVLSEGSEIEPDDLKFKFDSNLDRSLLKQQLTLKEYTIKIVQHFLDQNDKNVVETAKLLGVGKSTIYRMIQAQEVNL